MFNTILWVAVIVISVVLDRITKWLAVLNLKGEGSVSVIGDLLHFAYVENPGAAFGMMRNARWIFLIISTIAIGAMIFYLVKYKPKSRLALISLSMIIGGGIGNMIDRIRLGYVVDFIYIKIIDFAVFNIADSFVCVGTALLIIYIIFFDRKKSREKSAGSDIEEKQ